MVKKYPFRGLKHLEAQKRPPVGKSRLFFTLAKIEAVVADCGNHPSLHKMTSHWEMLNADKTPVLPLRGCGCWHASCGQPRLNCTLQPHETGCICPRCFEQRKKDWYKEWARLICTTPPTASGRFRDPLRERFPPQPKGWRVPGTPVAKAEPAKF
jgi:hypothetical protein